MSEVRKLHPGAAKNLKIIGIGAAAAAVVVGGMMTMSLSGGTKGPTSSVDVTSVKSSEGMSVERDDQLSPSQLKAVQVTQQGEARAAEKRGDFYIPGDQVGRPVPVEPAASAAPTESAEMRALRASGTDGVVTNQSVVSQSDSEIVAKRREGLQRQLAVLLEGGGDANLAPQRVSFGGVDGGERRADPGATALTQEPQGAQPSVAEGVEIAGAFEIVAAESASPIDTYKTTYASARIVAGPLRGALLFGTAKAADDGLVVTYNNMRLNGKAYSIDAWALDEATSTNALAADVDNRYFERMVLPILLAGVQGYNEKRSEQGSEVVVTGSGSTAVSTPAASAKQARAAGVSKGLEIANQEVQRVGAKPARFTMSERVPLGIMFRKPVLSTDLVK